MSFGTYRQYDSRWGKKNYNGSSSYATAGCGPTSCANILYAINPTITPLTTGNYMKSHGYAIRNNGTAWAGIPACLKAFGAIDVRQVDKMADVFDYCSRGYVGVFLFRKGTKGGVTWTTSGHYIAVTGYKHTNGKHYFQTFDSGSRKHDGWYCYETQMKGLIPRIWLCKVVEKKIPKPTGKYSGIIPNPTMKVGSKGESVKQLQAFLNWYYAFGLKVDGIFGSGTENATRMFQFAEGITADGIFGKNSYAKAYAYKATTPPPTPTPSGYTGSFPDLTTHSGQKIAYVARDLAYAKGTKKATYTYGKGKATAAFTAAINKVYPKRSSWSKQCQAGASCDVGAGTVIRYSGYDTTIPRGLQEQIPHLQKSKIWKKTGLTKTSQMSAGDVGIYIGKKKGAHIWIGLGGGLIAEANHTAKYFLHIDTDNYTNSGKKTWGIYRACSATAIRKGDKGSEVTKWQNFLKWYGYDIAADGIAGPNTDEATKAFQSKNGLSADGIVGSKTIEKAKTIKK